MSRSSRRLLRLLVRGTVKAAVTVAGAAVLAVGLVMVVTPGPAVAVIPAGLAILATEWDWARRLLTRFRERARGAAARIRRLSDVGGSDQPQRLRRAHRRRQQHS